MNGETELKTYFVGDLKHEVNYELFIRDFLFLASLDPSVTSVVTGELICNIFLTNWEWSSFPLPLATHIKIQAIFLTHLHIILSRIKKNSSSHTTKIWFSFSSSHLSVADFHKTTYKKKIFSRNIKRARNREMFFSFLFLPLSYCFFLDSFFRSHLVLDLRFFFFFFLIKSFIFLLFVFFFRKWRRKNTLWCRIRKSLLSGRPKKKKLLLWLLTRRVYDDDFSSQQCTHRKEKKKKQAEWKIRLKIKRKDKKNCLVNISFSYPRDPTIICMRYYSTTQWKGWETRTELILKLIVSKINFKLKLFKSNFKVFLT